MDVAVWGVSFMAFESLPDLARWPLLSSFPARPATSCYGTNPHWDRGWRKSCRETSPARTTPKSTAESWGATHIPMLHTMTGGKSISSCCLSSSSEAGESREWKGKKGIVPAQFLARGLMLPLKSGNWFTEISAQELLTLPYTEYSPCKEMEDEVFTSWCLRFPGTFHPHLNNVLNIMSTTASNATLVWRQDFEPSL